MKKYISALIALFFLVATTSTAVAGYNRHRSPYRYSPRHGYHRSYNRHPGYNWGAWGVGVLTGTLMSNIFYPPPSRTIVYRSPRSVVVSSPPVVVKEYHYETPPPVTVPDKVSVNIEKLNVRQGPGLNHPATGYVRLGEVLEVIGSAPEWLYVKTPSGLYGWVMVKYTATEAPPLG